MTVLPDKPGDARPDTCDPNLINPLRRVREAREAGLEPEIPALTPEEREFLLDRMGLDFVDRLLQGTLGSTTTPTTAEGTDTPTQTTKPETNTTP